MILLQTSIVIQERIYKMSTDQELLKIIIPVIGTASASIVANITQFLIHISSKMENNKMKKSASYGDYYFELCENILAINIEYQKFKSNGDADNYKEFGELLLKRKEEIDAELLYSYEQSINLLRKMGSKIQSKEYYSLGKRTNKQMIKLIKYIQLLIKKNDLSDALKRELSKKNILPDLNELYKLIIKKAK